jgi:F-type H+-transporting ATPase subunit a
MFISVALISLLMIGGVAGRQLVPGRFQSMAELSYEFVANTIRSSAGPEGMKFFPLVFSLFMFIMISNLIGIIPYTFTVSSHIIVTVALALLVFFTVLIYGFYKNGLKFFNLFVPAGIPIVILPLVVLIEIISFLSRPVSHSVRLFANMLAGHITLKVFASFVTMLGAFGVVGWAGAVLPLGLTVALTALAPEWAIGVGGFAEKRIRAVLEGNQRIVGADRVPPAGHHREPEPAIAGDGRIQLGHDDDEMVDALQHGARSFTRGGTVRDRRKDRSGIPWWCQATPGPRSTVAPPPGPKLTIFRGTRSVGSESWSARTWACRSSPACVSSATRSSSASTVGSS